MFLFPVPGRADAPARVCVKICGITHPADAEAAVTLGADALGLNFYPASPRCLDPARDAGWLRALAGVVPRVAVVVNASRREIDRLLGENLVDAVQLHGDEDTGFCLALAESGVPFAKALRVRGDESIGSAATFHTPWIVLDAYDPKAYGGTGQTTDWTLAARCVRDGEAAGFRVVLSGGLTPVNVAAAVRQVGPFGVDVASGVEKPDDRRRKDSARMEAFFSEIRSLTAI